MTILETISGLVSAGSKSGRAQAEIEAALTEANAKLVGWKAAAQEAHARHDTPMDKGRAATTLADSRVAEAEHAVTELRERLEASKQENVDAALRKKWANVRTLLKDRETLLVTLQKHIDGVAAALHAVDKSTLEIWNPEILPARREYGIPKTFGQDLYSTVNRSLFIRTKGRVGDSGGLTLFLAGKFNDFVTEAKLAHVAILELDTTSTAKGKA